MSYYTTSWLTINEHRVRNRSQEVVVTKYIKMLGKYLEAMYGFTLVYFRLVYQS